MIRILCIVLLSGLSAAIFAQAPSSSTMESAALPVRYANTITAEELKEHLAVLASDEMEGRETGEPGQKLAAQYLADQLADWGMPRVGENGSYFQSIYYTAEVWRQVHLEVNGEKARHLWDFYGYPATNTDLDTSRFGEIVFLGYGIDDERYSDYRGADVTGKVLLVFAGEPVGSKGQSLVTRSREVSDWSTDWRKKVRTAREKGAAALLIIDPDFKKNVANARKEIISSQLKLGKGEEPAQNYVHNFFISTSLAERMIGDAFQQVVKARRKIKQNGKPRKVLLDCELEFYLKKGGRQLSGENVLAFIEGRDESLKKELVVITAHYDHIGRRGEMIYNGADDNGSGTSAVLEICEAFVEAREAGAGPRRSVLVLFVSGEEKGLLGSEYYTSQPVFPLERTIVNINVDMVGRVDKKHEDNPDYIYVIGADRLSTDLHRINEQMNEQYVQLELDYTYNAPNDPNRYYYRSDHYNFARLGIPAIFYFNGAHPDYHRSTDTIDKINFEKMEKVARLIFHTAWELANRAERIQVDVPAPDKKEKGKN